MKYLIKRIIISTAVCVAVSLIMSFLSDINVHASTISQPNIFNIYFADGNSDPYTAFTNTNYWGYNIWRPNITIGYTTRAQFIWSNLQNVCSKSIVIRGRIVGDENASIFVNSVVAVTIENGSNMYNCSYVKNSNNIEFVCTTDLYFQHTGISVFYNNPSSIQNIFIGLTRDTSYTCEVSTTDLININNQNTQDIINNNNQNTQNIINNNNSNQQQTNQGLNNINTSLNNDDVSGGNSQANSFFSGFSNNGHGLTGIVSKPLTLINTFTSETCQPLSFNIKGQNFEIPCASFITSRPDFQGFLQVYNIIMGGLIAYGCSRGLFNKINDLKNPDNSKVEVLDL